MRIMHNIPALQGVNSLAAANGAMSKAVARLSTGLRINSAADDAAGLAISEKMRAQTSGLDRAAMNAQDGISLLQTAEGALGEVHSILQRMRELSVYAASDGLTSQDRVFIQLEVDQLTQQITDISRQTKFNRKLLLDGGSSVLWGSSSNDIGVVVTGTLLRRDQFGSLQSAAGNYKITFSTAQVGRESIQKSNIFTLKHGTLSTNAQYNITGDAGLVKLEAVNMVEGEWRIETRETPFGGVRYYRGGTAATPAEVGAAALNAQPSPSIAAPGEYDIRLSDRVPIMADFRDANTAGAVETVDVSDDHASRTFDAKFTTTTGTTGAGTSTIYRNNGGIDLAVGDGGGHLVEMNNKADTTANVFTKYDVVDTDRRDLSVETFIEESYVVANDAAVDVTLTYQSNDTPGDISLWFNGQTTTLPGGNYANKTLDQIAEQLMIDLNAVTGGNVTVTKEKMRDVTSPTDTSSANSELYRLRITNNTAQSMSLSGDLMVELFGGPRVIHDGSFTTSNGVFDGAKYTLNLPPNGTAADARADGRTARRSLHTRRPH